MDNDQSAKRILGNRYRLQQIIGTGGMAVVYLAWDSMLEREVAIKLLRQRFSRDPKFREQFHQEAKAAANLNHPNIVNVYDFGLDPNRLFIVMEYVPGTDLKTIINQKRIFSVPEALQLVSQACFGIGYAHRAGLIHCDVKPHNMLVTPDNRLKVTDFGIARALASVQPDEKPETVWGSPQYISPEQGAGEAPSTASDVYSLGVILYEMVTGQLPFQSDDPMELVRMHREVKPIPPRVLNPNISLQLETIILKVLSKSPTGRYRTADQLGRVLLSLNRDTSLTPTQTVTPQQTKTVTKPAESLIEKPVRISPPELDQYPTSAELSDLSIDWISLGLGILATIAVGGLFPFWIYVFFKLTSP